MLKLFCLQSPVQEERVEQIQHKKARTARATVTSHPPMLSHIFSRGASARLVPYPWSCTAARAIRSGLDVDGFVKTLTCRRCGKPGHRQLPTSVRPACSPRWCRDAVCPDNPNRLPTGSPDFEAEVDRRKGSVFKKEQVRQPFVCLSQPVLSLGWLRCRHFAMDCQKLLCD